MSNSQHTIKQADHFGWGPQHEALDPTKLAFLKEHIVGHRVADIGCASGRFAAFLQRQKYQVLGIDHSFSLLNKAIKTARHIPYLQADCTHLPLANKTVDTTIAFDIIEHLDDRMALKEIRRITTHRLIVCVPHKTADNLSQNYLLYGHHQDTTHLRTYTPSSLRQTLITAGFKSIHITPTHPLAFDALFIDCLQGPLPLRRVIRKLVHLLTPPQTFYTNLMAIADCP